MKYRLYVAAWEPGIVYVELDRGERRAWLTASYMRLPPYSNAWYHVLKETAMHRPRIRELKIL